jgi:CelD/BcsL family acetyltransferase involved in cellulose biosynthesis
LGRLWCEGKHEVAELAKNPAASYSHGLFERSCPMRAEIAAVAEEIQQSLTLLRRFL